MVREVEPVERVAHTALGRATQALLDEMVRAILELVDRYPQLGRHAARAPVLAEVEAGPR